MRLTDQALVAVLVAREHAAAHARAATAADVLVGLGTEPDGAAGAVLRGRGAALAALAERSAAPPPGLAALEAVVAAAADRAHPRPPATLDLLAAVLTVGGDDLDDLLAVCGYAPADLWPDEHARDGRPAAPGAPGGTGEALGGWRHVETVTIEDPATPPLTAPAARAVGRVRALAGGAVELLIALADDPGAGAADLLGEVDPEDLDAARDRMPGKTSATGAAGWDAGLEAVLDAAAILARERPAGTPELLQAVLVAGGSGPLSVLELARRAPQQEELP